MRRAASRALRAASRALRALALCTACACAPAETKDPPVSDPPPSDDGALVDAQLLAELTREQLESLVPPEVPIQNGYAVFSITYRTQGTDATGTVTVPDVAADAAPAQGFAVVANAHGTIGLDDACKLSGTLAGAGLAGLFGARGAVSVAPDYVGLGGPGLHPYLDVDSEARAVLDAIRAARTLAEERGLAMSARAAVVGLSQGGHAALAVGAHHAAYAPDIELKAIGAAAPASGFREHWTAIELAGAHQVYYAMLLRSFAHEAGRDVTDVFVPSFATDAAALFETRCAWSPTFDATEPLLPDALPTDPTDLYTAETRAAFGSPGQSALVDDGFSRVRLPAFVTDTPVRVWQGTADTTVLPAHTTALVDALRDGGQTVELSLVPDGTHLDTAFGFLASLDRAREESIAWVETQLAAPPADD